ncbi:hypothetical protein LIER_21159 [Lithospermum erythrorhizon]|uniref:Uncharacterized protein n=1 Tax=Lithospermum erythrorhizon TaxID=34254 RepID=A0AAV3QP96_LITER
MGWMVGLGPLRLARYVGWLDVQPFFHLIGGLAGRLTFFDWICGLAGRLTLFDWIYTCGGTLILTWVLGGQLSFSSALRVVLHSLVCWEPLWWLGGRGFSSLILSLIWFGAGASVACFMQLGRNGQLHFSRSFGIVRLECSFPLNHQVLRCFRCSC